MWRIEELLEPHKGVGLWEYTLPYWRWSTGSYEL